MDWVNSDERREKDWYEWMPGGKDTTFDVMFEYFEYVAGWDGVDKWQDTQSDFLRKEQRQCKN
jgi:hypothetical protein